MPSGHDEGPARPEGQPPLIAYPISPLEMPLMVAPIGRDWIAATPRHFAQRCLPLMIANRAGWLLISMHKFTVTWGGEESPASLTVQYQSGGAPFPAHSRFGSGILTFNIPFLFRTPPGVNLLVRGPANYFKDGIAPLEGIIETDWAETTFTMNWKVTRPHHAVTFESGEPVAMIVPHARGYLESFDPVIRDIATDQNLMNAYIRWMEVRDAQDKAHQDKNSDKYQNSWDGSYSKGISVAGNESASDHQQKIALKNFVEEPPPKT